MTHDKEKQGADNIGKKKLDDISCIVNGLLQSN